MMSEDKPNECPRPDKSDDCRYHQLALLGRKTPMSVRLSPSKSNGAVMFGSRARRSNAPMSAPFPAFGIAGSSKGRANPRWSVEKLKLLPLSTAGEFGVSACVGTDLPFKASTLMSFGLSGAAPVPL